jgi:TPR repeat protein
MKFPIFFLLAAISSASFSDANDVSYKAFMEIITDEHRIGVFKGYVESIEKNLPLAEGGDSAAMFRLYENFNLLAHIHKIEGASENAIYWLRQSAVLRHTEALKTLGHIYKNGNKTFNIETNLERAAEYFKLAWEQGDTSGKFHYMDIIECELPDEKAWDC